MPAEDLGTSRLRLTTDESELDAGLDRAEARTRGFLDRVQGSMKGILGKSVAAFVATGFAAATGQGVKLNEVLNEVQSETGATGDQWAAMEATIRRENGRTTESVDDIADAVKSMRQDLGLTGAEIDKYADRIFDAGLATHMGAVAITKATDDIGDAYELDIDRALGSIDQLIAGQERWGGDLQARIDALPGLAKGIKGLGGTVDDAIALLNVASARGLDYAEVQKAVNAAVGKFKVPPDLKEVIGLQDLHKTKTQLAREEVEKIEAALKEFVAPDELKKLIAQIDGIADPTLRAAAAERIYNEQVAALNSDPIARYLDILGEIPDAQARTQRAVEIFGPKAGPIWAELASKVHEAGGSLNAFNVSQDEAGHRAEELARDLDRGPIRSVKLLFESLGAGLADLGSNPLVTGVASLGTILGGFAPNLSGKIGGKLIDVMKGAWGKVAASAVVSSAVELVADKAATVYLKALFAGDALSAALTAVWARVIALPAVGTAIGVAGGAAGTAFAAAFAEAFLAAPLIPLIFAFKFVEEHPALPSMAKQQEDFLAQQKAKYEQGGAEAGAAGAEALNDAWASSSAEFAARQGRPTAAAIAGHLAPPLNAAAKTVGSDFAAQMLSHFMEINKAGPAMAAAARRLANLAGLNVAQGIKSQRQTIDQAWQDMLDGLKDATSVTGRTAHLLGLLSAKELIKGLNSADPAVRAQARGTKQLILDELAALKPRAGTLSKDAMENLRKAMRSKDPDIRRAATAIYNAAIHGNNNNGPASLPAKGTQYGSRFIENVIRGMNSQQKALALASAGLAGIARDHFQLSSPAKLGPWSKRGGPEGWGRRFTEFLLRGISADLPAIQGVIAHALEVPSAPIDRLHSSLHSLRLPNASAALSAATLAGASATASPVSRDDRPASLHIDQINLYGVGSDVSEQRAADFGRRIMREVASNFRHEGARNGLHPERA